MRAPAAAAAEIGVGQEQPVARPATQAAPLSPPDLAHEVSPTTPAPVLPASAPIAPARPVPGGSRIGPVYPHEAVLPSEGRPHVRGPAPGEELRPVALIRLLGAHMERVARREALLAQAASPPGGPILAAKAEAAPALQAPPAPPQWMPAWLAPPPQPHARSPAPAPALPGPAQDLTPATLAQDLTPEEGLREQLARILRDDALRHGIDLKGE